MLRKTATLYYKVTMNKNQMQSIPSAPQAKEDSDALSSITADVWIKVCPMNVSSPWTYCSTGKRYFAKAKAKEEEAKRKR